MTPKKAHKFVPKFFQKVNNLFLLLILWLKFVFMNKVKLVVITITMLELDVLLATCMETWFGLGFEKIGSRLADLLQALGFWTRVSLSLDLRRFWVVRWSCNMSHGAVVTSRALSSHVRFWPSYIAFSRWILVPIDPIFTFFGKASPTHREINFCNLELKHSLHPISCPW
jgi:hypothetical protein